MTKTLTEQWRAGNLKNSFYYLKFPDTETAEIYNLYDMEKFRYVQDSEKIEVLDEVPSYEEYNELATKCNQLQKRLEIATKALEYYTLEDAYVSCYGNPVNPNPMVARKALKEMEGVR